MTKTFLDDLVSYAIKHFERLEDLQIIFPNRRAGLFFQKALGKAVGRPTWSPEIKSLEDFICDYDSLQVSDPLVLIFELYDAFRMEFERAEGIENFYFWGEMLLKDFEDVDQSLASPDQIFQGVKSQKELEEFFYFLDEEDKKAVLSFWSQFLPEASQGQEQFLKTWKVLKPVYYRFREQLIQKEMAYKAMVYRRVAEKCKQELIEHPKHPILFAGFNAFTPAEEAIVKYFLGTHGAHMVWDYDEYYLKDDLQEAGTYLRTYQKDPVFGKTFSKAPNNLEGGTKSIKSFGVSLQIGQAKAAGDLIARMMKEGEVDLEKTVVVLPKEHMLMPVLHSLPESLSKINITMGYPLRETPLYSLLESLISLQQHISVSRNQQIQFYYKPVIEILTHPYIRQASPEMAISLPAHIREQNIIQVSKSMFDGSDEILNSIFEPLDDTAKIVSYLEAVLKVLYQILEQLMDIEKEYFVHFQKVINHFYKLQELQNASLSIPLFLKLFRQVCRSVRIPFSGEPLAGLQVMGVLETRNLDFEHVILLNMNEGSFPDSKHQSSFIPYNIRKAFGLPTISQQDAIYAYLFYRLIQRASMVTCFYNTQSEFGLSGEPSRYLQQLKFESTLEVEEHNFSQPVLAAQPRTIVIEKNDEVLAGLDYYVGNGSGAFTPTAFSTYINCKLQFYYRYVCRLYEPKAVQEELDPALFGNILHKAMELLYDDLIKEKQTQLIESSDFSSLRKSVDDKILKAFQLHFNKESDLTFEVKGRNVILAEVVKKYVLQVLRMDEDRAPFEIVALEGTHEDGYKFQWPINVNGDQLIINLKGIIDRIDRKDGQIRILDYKSGKDSRELKSLDSLFDATDDKRNKAAFQLLFYTLLYQHKHGDQEPVSPGLYNIREMFGDAFDTRLQLKDHGPIEDIRPWLDSYRGKLDELLIEIFDRQTTFTQTEDLRKCQYCAYKDLCGR